MRSPAVDTWEKVRGHAVLQGSSRTFTNESSAERTMHIGADQPTGQLHVGALIVKVRLDLTYAEEAGLTKTATTTTTTTTTTTATTTAAAAGVVVVIVVVAAVVVVVVVAVVVVVVVVVVVSN